MLYLYSAHTNYAIGWSPKAGCTMWRHLFLILHKDEVKQPIHFQDQWHHHFSLPNPTRPPYQFIPCDHIVVVRNPYCRLVSCFTNKVCKFHDEPTLYNKVPMAIVSFRCFVYGLKHLMFKDGANLNEVDIHLAPQTFNYREYGYTTFVKLEEFDDKIIDVYKKLKLNKFIPKIKQFLKDKKDAKIGINKTPKIKCKYTVCDKEYNLQTREFPDYRYFYDEELLEIVYEIYKDDFEAFGYEKYKV